VSSLHKLDVKISPSHQLIDSNRLANWGVTWKGWKVSKPITIAQLKDEGCLNPLNHNWNFLMNKSNQLEGLAQWHVLIGHPCPQDKLDVSHYVCMWEGGRNTIYTRSVYGWKWFTSTYWANYWCKRTPIL
jgi:hypothetical protein